MNRLWKEWKSQQRAPELDQFDGLIATLHEWEEIRYPKPGVSMIGYAYQKSSGTPRRRSRSPKEYQINLEEMDELVFVLLNKRVTRDWFHYAIWSGTGEGLAQYERENLHKLF